MEPLSSIECLSLILAVGNASQEELDSKQIEPITKGVANLAWVTEKAGLPLVLKRYTDLDYLRIEPELLGVIDRHAWLCGSGPRVLYSSPLGLVAERVPGQSLAEQDIHKGDWALLRNVARALSRFHQLRVPAQCEGSPMLWRTVDKMMDAVVRQPGLLPPGMPSVSTVLKEISSARAAVERQRPAVVLGHGDCKPSNVIIHGENCDQVTFIDFELGGPNYRGYDLMKFLRSDEAPSESCTKHFIRSYAESLSGHVGEEAVKRLTSEVYMFEPLTWLEASIFFLVLPMFDKQNKEKYNLMAVDRWTKFLETKHKLHFSAVSQVDCLSLLLTIANTYKEDLVSMGLEPLTVGFANLVWATEKNGQPLVLKRYTDLVFLRIEPEAIGVVDKHAWDFGVGPRVLYSSHLGLVAERVPGRTLEEKDMHKGDWGLLGNVAKALAQFHALPVPLQCQGSPMLWRTVDKMIDAVVRQPGLIPTGMPYISVIISEIAAARNALEKCQPSIVLGHGDCKPSNIIVSGGHSEQVTLIDFELGGPNYRAFDLMKLFRTAAGASEPCMRYFFRAYLEASGAPAGEEAVDSLLCEAHMFEPLTWLEACVFFLALPMFKASDTARWNTLALDRWEKFIKTKPRLLDVVPPDHSPAAPSRL